MQNSVNALFLSLALALTACDSGSGSNPAPPETVAPIISLDQTNSVTPMDEGQDYELTPFIGPVSGSSVRSWQWSDQPVVAGRLTQCFNIAGFDRSRAASRLEAACTRPENCVIAFDQISTVNTTGVGQTRFKVSIPKLKAPIGLTYRLQSVDDIGDLTVDDYTFCLVNKNDPPVAVDDVFTVIEGQRLEITSASASNMLSNDEDDDDVGNSPLAVFQEPLVAPQLADQFSLKSDGGFTYFYRGDPNVAGGVIQEDRFEYEITDGTGRSSATVTLKIVANDDPPEFVENPEPLQIVAGIEADQDLRVYFTDPEGSQLSFAVNPSELPGNGLTVTALGLLTGLAGNDDVGNYVINVTASDQNADTLGQIPLEIANNRSPEVTAIPDVSIANGELVSISVADNITDPEGANLNFSLQSSPESDLQINQATGLISGTIINPGTYLLSVTASDGVSADVTNTFTLTQQGPANRPPRFESDPIAGQTVTLGLSIVPITPDFRDPDEGDVLTYTISQSLAGTGLVFDPLTGDLTGQPARLGVLNLQISATDQDGLSDSSNRFSITTTEAPNEPPVFDGPNIGPVSATVDVEISGVSGNFSDPELEELLYSSTPLPAGLTLDPSTGVISGAPTAAVTLSVTITATDPDQASISSNEFVIEVSLPPNTPPVFNPPVIPSTEVTVGFPIVDPVSGNFSDSDPDDVLIYTITPDPLPEGFQFDPLSGALSGTPLVEATTTFQISASDPSGATALSNLFSITVVPLPNEAPTFEENIDPVTVTFGFPIPTITALFDDVDDDNDDLSYTIDPTVADTGLSFDEDTATLTGVPAALGTLEFVITATDPDGASADSNSFTIETTDVPNQAPEFNEPPIGDVLGTVGTEIDSVSGNFSDPELETLTYTSSSLPAGLSLNPNTGVISGTPTAETQQPVTVTITATDPDDASVSSNPFTITVSPVPNSSPEFIGPDLQPETLTVNVEMTPINGNFIDADLVRGDLLTYTTGTLPSGLGINELTGVISGTPNTVAPAVTVQIIATDVSGATATSNEFTIEVVAAATANNPPQFIGEQIDNVVATVEVQISIGSNGSFIDTDEGDELTYSNTGVLPDGLTIDPLTGVISGAPTTATAAPVTLTIVATDTGLLTAETNPFSLSVVASPVFSENPVFDGPDILDATGTVGIEIEPISGNFSDGSNTAELVYSSSDLPLGLVIDQQSGIITGEPLVLAVSATDVTITATDITGAFATSNPFDITINTDLANNLPVFNGNIPDIEVLADTEMAPFLAPVSDQDVDDVLLYSIVPDAAVNNLLFNVNTGGLSGFPIATESYTIFVTDQVEGTVPVSSNLFTITVIPAVINNVPMLVTGVSDQTLVVGVEIDPPLAAIFTDEDGIDTLTYTVFPDPLPYGLEFSGLTGEIFGIPSDIGPAVPFTITATDDGEATASDTFSIEVIEDTSA